MYRTPGKNILAIVILSLSIAWGLIYILFDTLHGMQLMFDRQFPFLVARLLGVHNLSMNLWEGVAYSMADAGILGAVVGWLLRRLLLGKS